MIMGWFNIYAAVFNEEESGIFNITQLYGKQFFWILSAIFLSIVAVYIDNHFYLFFSYIIYGAVMVLLVLVLIFGKEINSARSWFELGPFSLQPSEFAKFATALALANYLNSQRLDLTYMKAFIPAAFIILLPAAFILLQPDMGSAIVFVSLFFVLFREGMNPIIFIAGILMIVLFLATLLMNNLILELIILGVTISIMWFLVKEKKKYLIGLSSFLIIGGLLYILDTFFIKSLGIELILLIATFLEGLIISYYSFLRKSLSVLTIYLFLLGGLLYINSVDFAFNNILKPHQKSRIELMLGLKSDPHGSGYNLNQSLISIGSGGLTGKGYLQGTQTKFKFVPAQSTDFIFCTVGEEWGFIGSTILIGLYLLLILRLVFLAERQRSVFSRAYGYGVASIFFFHVFINIGMTIGLMPVIGIPLPFFSYGGSSLWGFTILLFIFLKLDATRTEHLV